MNSQLFYRGMSKFYDLLDVVYFRKPGTSPRRFVFHSVKDGDRVLDLCAGTGTNSVAIAKRYPNSRVVAVDLSRDMLIVARAKAKEAMLRNIKFYRMDATKLKIKEECFDKVLLSLVLHETTEELAGEIIKEAYRVLKPNGEIIITEWRRSEELLRKLLFLPIDLLEPEPYKTFINKDLHEYFADFGLDVIIEYDCDYSKVLRLRKM